MQVTKIRASLRLVATAAAPHSSMLTCGKPSVRSCVSAPTRFWRSAPEPQGRLRFLSEGELVRLLAACEAKAATLAMTMRYAHLAEGHVRHAMNALRFS